MAALQRFAAIMLADLRERTRSMHFWAMLLTMICAIWWCFPTPDDGYMILSLNHGERGEYSSAWVGMVLAMAFSLLLGLGGFYMVRGTLVRDFETRVWQLLVSTPMTRSGYLLAKWASHMVILTLIVLIGLVVGIIAQWMRGEDRSYDLIELVKPLLLLTVPGLAVTSMFAVWFDLLPWLRRTAGNVLFFFVWSFLTAISISQFDGGDKIRLLANWRSDPHGLVVATRDFNRVREAQTGESQGFGLSVGSPRPKSGPVIFEWKVWNVRPLDAFGRLLWVVFSIAGVMAAAPLVDWAAARGSSKAKAQVRTGSRLRWLDALLTPIARGPFTILTIAELKLVLRERRWWWWLLALVALGLQTFGSGDGFQMGLLLAWILPLDMLARGILREVDHRTGGLMFAAPNIQRRLLAARFAVGFSLLLALTAVGTLRLLVSDPIAAMTCVLISASIVSWGLSLGALTRNPRAFEIGLVTLVYLATQKVPVFDVIASPLTTAYGHVLMLIPAWFVLTFAWPRLARV